MNKIFFSNNLLTLRKHAGLKQYHMQEELGIMRNTWSNWENGKAQPDMEMLCRIADFFGLEVGQLIASDISKDLLLPENTLKDEENMLPLCVECRLKESIIATQKQAIRALQGQVEALKDSMDLLKQRKKRKSP